ncbi:unnamed protein product [Cuscuta epithymum]|uniref:F-box domain-containing protein n=1 Tax=Cuscuta epithymum TaxID=186058 RepID=A0AAV0C3D7_9ASTE|nr:unnamed protein product [Cuscuta epithymum]
MEDCIDFTQWLGPDMSIKILSCLEDPSDLVRASAVSTSWHQLVIESSLCKDLCLREFPEIAGLTDVIEKKHASDTAEVELGKKDAKLSRLERNHQVYAFLSRGLSSFMMKNCITEALCASSTDNYPEESIQNTLLPSDMVGHRASYWSSKGESDPTVPETLTYKLASRLCLVTEIHVQPFQAYFQFGFPIYSAKALRFRLGHCQVPMESERNNITDETGAVKGPLGEKFVWTYTSPEFPMAQERKLQKFKLPEPVLCIGGILQLQLLGRVQRQDVDDLFYICVAHVRVVGRPLSPAFDVEIRDQSGKFSLKYYPEKKNLAKSGDEHLSGLSRFNRFAASIRSLHTVLGVGGAFGIEEEDDGDDEAI